MPSKKVIDRICKYYRLYYMPIIILLLLIEVAVWSLLDFYESTSDLDRTLELMTQAIVTICMTGAGIWVPIHIQSNKQKEQDRRILVYHLGFIWNELRVNQYILDQVKLNYKNYELIFTFSPNSQLINLLSIKINAIGKLIDDLTDNSFIASQYSGAVTKHNSDHVFNNIMQSYEDTKRLKVQFHALCEDLKMKDIILNNKLSGNRESEIDQVKKILNELNSRFDIIWKEINITYNVISNTIDSTDKALDKLGVKAEEVERIL